LDHPDNEHCRRANANTRQLSHNNNTSASLLHTSSSRVRYSVTHPQRAMRILLCLAVGAAAVAVEKRRGRVSSPPLPPQKVPVIGILAQPSTRTPFKQYVASSYVKWVEMAGGVAVPMSYVASNATTLNLLKQLDGVLLPGGSNPPLPDAARVSVEYALEAATRNESFPVWGTCLGFEWLVEILALTQREK
jgi:hypothetical protein